MLISVAEISDQKYGKKSLFLKIVRVRHIFSKSGCFWEISRTDRIFYVQKNKIPMVRPIVFDQKSRKWPHFSVIGSRKGNIKDQNLNLKIIIFYRDYEKNVHFVKFWSKKMPILRYFCDKYAFFSLKLHFLEYTAYFLWTKKAWKFWQFFILGAKSIKSEQKHCENQ